MKSRHAAAIDVENESSSPVEDASGWRKSSSALLLPIVMTVGARPAPIGLGEILCNTFRIQCFLELQSLAERQKTPVQDLQRLDRCDVHLFIITSRLGFSAWAGRVPSPLRPSPRSDRLTIGGMQPDTAGEPFTVASN